jgi:hypothetical protein
MLQFDNAGECTLAENVILGQFGSPFRKHFHGFHTKRRICHVVQTLPAQRIPKRCESSEFAISTPFHLR